MTVSCGLAQLDPNEHHQQFLQRADVAMYAAKQGGRNQTSWHDGQTIHRVAQLLLPQVANSESRSVPIVVDLPGSGTLVDAKMILAAYEAGVDYTPVVLRISTAYGLSPRMRFDLTISEFTRTLAAGEELVVYDADTWRPYCHVEDISKAVMTVMEADADDVAGEVFNVGHSDENYTKRMIVDVVQDVLDGAGVVQFEEGGRDPRNYRVSFEKIREQLGYEPDHRVPQTVASLVDAVRAGAYVDFPSRPGFYTNHAISERFLAGEPGGDGG